MDDRMTQQLMRIVNLPWFMPLLLAFPLFPVSGELMQGQQLQGIFKYVGEWAARFTLITLALTPLVMAFPQFVPLRWLMKHRRQIGMAAFFYALLHAGLYVLLHSGMSQLVEGLSRPVIVTGWLTLVAFVPPAVTSTDYWLRRLGPQWKNVQRITYMAAVMALVHWLLASNKTADILLQVVPLMLLEGWRLVRMLMRKGDA